MLVSEEDDGENFGVVVVTSDGVEFCRSRYPGFRAMVGSKLFVADDVAIEEVVPPLSLPALLTSKRLE
jgi:hypothetical protein